METVACEAVCHSFFRKETLPFLKLCVCNFSLAFAIALKLNCNKQTFEPNKWITQHAENFCKVFNFDNHSYAKNTEVQSENTAFFEFLEVFIQVFFCPDASMSNSSDTNGALDFSITGPKWVGNGSG